MTAMARWGAGTIPRASPLSSASTNTQALWIPVFAAELCVRDLVRALGNSGVERAEANHGARSRGAFGLVRTFDHESWHVCLLIGALSSLRRSQTAGATCSISCGSGIY